MYTIQRGVTFREMLKTNFITFPVGTDKRPLIKKWSKLSASSRSRARWGIPCGEVNNLTVVDVDVDDGGLEYWGKLIEQHGDIATSQVQTPSGGLHLYLTMSQELRTGLDQLKTKRASQLALMCGLRKAIS